MGANLQSAGPIEKRKWAYPRVVANLYVAQNDTAVVDRSSFTKPQFFRLLPSIHNVVAERKRPVESDVKFTPAREPKCLQVM